MAPRMIGTNKRVKGLLKLSYGSNIFYTFVHFYWLPPDSQGGGTSVCGGQNFKVEGCGFKAHSWAGVGRCAGNRRGSPTLSELC